MGPMPFQPTSDTSDPPLSLDTRTTSRGPEMNWPTMESEAPGRTLQEEDAEEWARQEQLAAMLRCMGFDEEPSLHAAQRAGGNLNVAVESVLQSSGITG